jgi:hypothetical protein
MIPFKVTEADQSNSIPSWIKYSLPSGESFYNISEGSKAKGLTSQQIYEREFFELCFDKVENDSFKEIQDDKKTTSKLKGVF